MSKYYFKYDDIGFYPADGSREHCSSALNCETVIKSILGENGEFSKKIPEFKVRAGQLTMATRWYQNLIDGRSFICEAGTGTGKTFAYLIPALLSGQKIVIATGTKALQDQLMQKDLPAVFNLLNMQPSYMALKGFSNYLCRSRFKDAKNRYDNSLLKEFDKSEDNSVLADEEESPYLDAGIIKKLDALISKSLLEINTGSLTPSFAEVSSVLPYSLLNAVTCSSEWCNRKNCEYASVCFPYLARVNALSVQVLVVNHSLFFADMVIEDRFDEDSAPILFPKYQAVVFDEAHELSKYGREHFSDSIGSYDLKVLKEDLKYYKKNVQQMPLKPFKEWYKTLKELFLQLDFFIRGHLPEGMSKVNLLYFKYFDYDKDNTDPFCEYKKERLDFIEKMRSLYVRLGEYLRFLKTNKIFDEMFIQKRIDYVESRCLLIKRLMLIDNKDPKVNPFYGRYVATVGITSRSFAITLTPLDISDVFGEYLKKCEIYKVGVLMTSATLSVNHQFKKFIEDIGADEHTETLEVESSFAYERQACRFLSRDFPSKDDGDRILKIITMLDPLIDKVQGGIFFLTTSMDALSKARICLLNRYSSQRKILCQGMAQSNAELIKSFRADGNAILIGTSSFWEGVDVKGQALSLVIIDKLPFQNFSDPIFQARCQYYDVKKGKKASFHGISLPEAVIELRQGVGRLIRHENDRGGLIICDPRLLTVGYGKTFLNSLPKMQTLDSLDKMLDFINFSPENNAIS